MNGVVSAHSSSSISADAAAEIIEKLGFIEPRVILFFGAISQDGQAIGSALSARFPAAEVIGCSGNGEFTDTAFGKGGVSAIALSSAKVGRAASALVTLAGGIEEGVRAAAESLSTSLGESIRKLDPAHFVGIGLLEGATGREEKVNEALGMVAPYLTFVGGSAGDNIAFKQTWVFAQGKLEHDGCALLVLEMKTPFAILKTCNFVATDHEVVVTKADPDKRLIHELDGKPAAAFYAEAIGTTADKLGFPEFMAHPFGLMIDDKPWLRSGARCEGESLFFACSVLPGTRLNFMRATDMIQETRAAFDEVETELGSRLGGAILFNCTYRMLEAQIKGFEPAYHQSLERVVHAGFHTHGESWLGHINQTLTGLVFL